MPISFQSNQAPAYLEANLKALAERAYELGNLRTPPYEHERIAPLPLEIRRAIEMAGQGDLYKPGLDEAYNLIQQISRQKFPQHHKEYINPYQEQVIRNMENESMRTFNENILPALENKFVRLGQHGGKSHREMVRRATSDLQNELADRRQRLMHAGYESAHHAYTTDLDRKRAAAKELADLGITRQAAHLTDIGALQSAGSIKQKMAQLDRDIRYQNYLHEMSKPYHGLAAWSAAIHGLPFSSARHTFENPVQAAPQVNAIGNIGNISSSILSSRLAAPPVQASAPAPAPVLPPPSGRGQRAMSPQEYSAFVHNVNRGRQYDTTSGFEPGGGNW